ncbi:riboflavin biosynthesis protein RibD [Bacteroidia bacterium]|nr:riboflavin biosynthesis protein RibD [Bacteroidia bacterium]
MDNHHFFMQRCLQIARNGLGNVAPNPMVGAVLVHHGKIIAEGYHRACGLPHAEVEAIGQVNNHNLLKNSTLYVSLEPCCHFGKTPPCTDLILASKIPRVVAAVADPFHKVNGGGIERLQKSGVEVITGVLEQEAQHLNRRFFTYHTQQRPYISLKWAQTADGFIDKQRTPNEPPATISNAAAHRLSHWWRGQEQAIMVGTRTAFDDNPSLTTRLCAGKNPIRVVVDADGKLPKSLQLFDNQSNTIVIETRKVAAMLQILYDKGIQSVIVEGGAALLQSFISSGLWDEARVFVAPQQMGKGVAAPTLHGDTAATYSIGNNTLRLIFPTNTPKNAGR